MAKQTDLMRCDKAANFDDLMRAVIVVHDTLEQSGSKQGSDKWISHSKYRKQLFSMVVNQWCNVTELGDEYFPWNVDFVCRMYPAYRKRNDDQKAEIKRDLFGHSDQLEAV